ncbi:MAG: type restriction enzyme protein [Thermoplasmata archaeon]|jgi:type I restriction enzyme M protein|nr:type restriction enzyme protein [Thermoplasmata archaeon]
MTSHQDRVAFIWSIAESLRGPYKPHEYGQVILPLVVLRRLDAVMAPQREAIQKATKEAVAKGLKDPAPMVKRRTGLDFYNTSNFSFDNLTDDAGQLAQNLKNYIQGFSPNARDILERFGYDKQIDKLRAKQKLFQVLEKFRAMDLGPDDVSNHDMGYVYEELLRKFSELSNETAGDHFTPRDVVRLMVDLLLAPDDDVLGTKGRIAAIYDPACGTGGMLTVARERILEFNKDAHVMLYGQEWNDETYAVANSDMLIHGLETSRIRPGNTLTQDAFSDERFDYMMANPPFGVDWSDYADPLREEHERGTPPNRFHAGLPRKSDGALLFLQHMVSKMRDPKDGGARIGIVFNGSPLFTGDAGSGESEIRRSLIESDLLEAIVGLPDQLFYNTGISTYIWILSNRKPKERRGKIQLIDARGEFVKARKSFGDKRKDITEENRRRIVEAYADFEESKTSKILDSKSFGYRVITVERPLQLNFAADEARLLRVRALGAFQALAEPDKGLTKAQQDKQVKEGQAVQERVIQAFAKLGAKPTTDHETFRARVKAALEEAAPDTKWTPSNVNAIVRALGEHDDKAPVIKKGGKPEPDNNLRDRERVPLGQSIHEYVREEVLPWVPDAWVDEAKRDEKDSQVGVVGYEINFNRHFYEYVPPRPLEEIDAELQALEKEISGLLKQVAV